LEDVPLEGERLFRFPRIPPKRKNFHEGEFWVQKFPWFAYGRRPLDRALPSAEGNAQSVEFDVRGLPPPLLATPAAANSVNALSLYSKKRDFNLFFETLYAPFRRGASFPQKRSLLFLFLSRKSSPLLLGTLLPDTPGNGARREYFLPRESPL